MTKNPGEPGLYPTDQLHFLPSCFDLNFTQPWSSRFLLTSLGFLYQRYYKMFIAWNISLWLFSLCIKTRFSWWGGGCHEYCSSFDIGMHILSVFTMFLRYKHSCPYRCWVLLLFRHCVLNPHWSVINDMTEKKHQYTFSEIHLIEHLFTSVSFRLRPKAQASEWCSERTDTIACYPIFLWRHIYPTIGKFSLIGCQTNT